MQLSCSTVRVGTQDLCYSTNGIAQKPAAPSLVLIHGAGGSLMDWPQSWRSAGRGAQLGFVGQRARLPGLGGHVLKGLAIYAVDLPGHGSSKGASRNDIAAYGGQVAGFLAALDLRNVCLVGHSMGVPVALDAALEAADRVTSLCLIAGAARMNVSPALLDGLRNEVAATVAAIAKACWHKSTAEHFRKTTRQRMLAAGSAVLVDDFFACGAVDLRRRLPEIEVPALVVAAEEDRMVPAEDSKAMSDALPAARLLTYPRCGHFLHVERSADIAVEIRDFLSGPAAPPAPRPALLPGDAV